LGTGWFRTLVASTLNWNVLNSVGLPAEIEQLFLDFQSMGVPFHQALTKQPWGAKNFIVKDPDGNLLLFAGPAD
jgi:hypothetical protein